MNVLQSGAPRRCCCTHRRKRPAAPKRPAEPAHLVARAARERQEVAAHALAHVDKVERRDALCERRELVEQRARAGVGQAVAQRQEHLLLGDADVLLGRHDEGFDLACGVCGALLWGGLRGGMSIAVC